MMMTTINQDGGGIGDLSPNRRVDAAGGKLSLEEKIEEYLRRKNSKKHGMFNDEIDIEEYLRMKNSKKHGLFNDEIDIGVDYYEDFNDGDVEDRDNISFYDYYDFIANSDPGVYKGYYQTIKHLTSQSVSITITSITTKRQHQNQSIRFKLVL